MYDNENGVYLKSVEVVNQESLPKEPPKEPPPAPPPTEPKEAPEKKFTEAAPLRKSKDTQPPTRP